MDQPISLALWARGTNTSRFTASKESLVGIGWNRANKSFDSIGENV